MQLLWLQEVGAVLAAVGVGQAFFNLKFLWRSKNNVIL